MKKIYSLIAMLLPLAGLTACSDDSTPDVDIKVSFEGVTRVDNVLYVVEGNTIDITGVTITDNSGKGAVIGGVNYMWDGFSVARTIVQPYAVKIDTEGVPVGNHLLEIDMSVYAIDYPPCIGYLGYKVEVVADQADIPTQGSVEANPQLEMLVHEKPTE